MSKFAPPHDNKIIVEATAEYIPEQSDPGESRYVFAYHIKISNQGDTPAQLISRHWLITDGDGQQEEVRGQGVIGEQPWIAPGETYDYSSGCALPTPFGSMRGSYHMVNESQASFQADIPEFFLVGPRVLH